MNSRANPSELRKVINRAFIDIQMALSHTLQETSMNQLERDGFYARVIEHVEAHERNIHAKLDEKELLGEK